MLGEELRLCLGRGQEEEGVSSLRKARDLLEYRQSLLSSKVKEVSSLAVQGAKSSIPVSLESKREKQEPSRSRKEDLSSTSAHRSVSLPIFLCITMSRPGQSQISKEERGSALSPESRESSSFLERGLWLTQPVYLKNG